MMAAMRSVLRDMVDKHQDATNDDSDQQANQLHKAGYVHDPSKDLHIITGHSQNRANKQGSTLQPVIMAMLNSLGIAANFDENKRGLLIIPSSELQRYLQLHCQTESSA